MKEKASSSGANKRGEELALSWAAALEKHEPPKPEQFKKSEELIDKGAGLGETLPMVEKGQAMRRDGATRKSNQTILGAMICARGENDEEIAKLIERAAKKGDQSWKKPSAMFAWAEKEVMPVEHLALRESKDETLAAMINAGLKLKAETFIFAMWASHGERKLRLAKLLLDHGVSVSRQKVEPKAREFQEAQKEDKFETALDRAVSEDSGPIEEVIDLLWAALKKESPKELPLQWESAMMQAAQSGSGKALLRLLRNGAQEGLVDEVARNKAVRRWIMNAKSVEGSTWEGIKKACGPIKPEQVWKMSELLGRLWQGGFGEKEKAEQDKKERLLGWLEESLDPTSLAIALARASGVAQGGLEMRRKTSELDALKTRVEKAIQEASKGEIKKNPEPKKAKKTSSARGKK